MKEGKDLGNNQIKLGGNWIVATKCQKLQRNLDSCNQIKKVATKSRKLQRNNKKTYDFHRRQEISSVLIVLNEMLRQCLEGKHQNNQLNSM